MATPHLHIKMDHEFHKSPYRPINIESQVEFHELHKIPKGTKFISIANLTNDGAYLQISNVNTILPIEKVKNDTAYAVDSGIFNSIDFYINLDEVAEEESVEFDVTFS